MTGPVHCVGRRGSPVRTLLLLLPLALVVATACSPTAGSPAAAPPATERGPLVVGGIPDQDPERLQRQFGLLAAHLGDRLGVETVYEPVAGYDAAVTAFRVGDLDLVWFGGLTGVQARLQVPGAEAIAQRDIDAQFHSVFIAGTDTGIEPFDDVAGLRALAGHTFTFGSDASTSGRLMPQHFLGEAGVGLDDLRGGPGFSGSHDATIALVESGSFDAGALNEQVWRTRVEEGVVDTGAVRAVFRTPAYFDYHWVARPELDERFGEGFTQEVTDALLALDADDPQARAILDLFGAERFVETRNANYATIEQVGRAAGLITVDP